MSARAVGRIRQRSAFVALRRPKGRASAGPVRVSWVPAAPTDPFPLVGYAIGRRCGNAVTRNRLRRQLRAAVSATPPPPGRYLVAAQPGAVDLGFGELASAVGSAMTSAAAKGSR